MDSITKLVKRNLSTYGHVWLSLDRVDQPAYLAESALHDLKERNPVGTYPSKYGGYLVAELAASNSYAVVALRHEMPESTSSKSFNPPKPLFSIRVCGKGEAKSRFDCSLENDEPSVVSAFVSLVTALRRRYPKSHVGDMIEANRVDLGGGNTSTQGSFEPYETSLPPNAPPKRWNANLVPAGPPTKKAHDYAREQVHTRGRAKREVFAEWKPMYLEQERISESQAGDLWDVFRKAVDRPVKRQQSGRK